VTSAYSRRRLLALASSVPLAALGGKVVRAVGMHGLNNGVLVRPTGVVPASAFFPGGAKVASDAITGVTKLAGMPSLYTKSLNIDKTLWFDQMPTSAMRFLTTTDPTSAFEISSLTLYPPGASMSVFNRTVQRFDKTAFGLPSFVLQVISGAVALSFVVALNRFPLGEWWRILLILNDASVVGSNVLKAWQYIKGEPPSSADVQSVQVGFASAAQPVQTVAIPTAGQIAFFTGMSGAQQANITIGGVPNTIGGLNSVTNVAVGSVIVSPQAADVATAIRSAAPGPTGFFTRPTFGAPDYFNPNAGLSSVAMMGEVNSAGIGFLDNTGIQNVLTVNGNWTTLPTMFGDVGAQPVEPADTLYYADPFY
jgi:hypothetical protein